MKFIDLIATIFMIFGALNWGLVGVMDYNIVLYTFIAMSRVQHAIYIAIGLAGLWKLFYLFRGMPTR